MAKRPDYKARARELLLEADLDAPREMMSLLASCCTTRLMDVPEEHLPPFAKWLRERERPSYMVSIIDWQLMCETLEAWLSAQRAAAEECER